MHDVSERPKTQKQTFAKLLDADAFELMQIGGTVTSIWLAVGRPLLFKVAIEARHLQEVKRDVFAGTPASAVQWRTAGGEYFISMGMEGDLLRIYLGHCSNLQAILEAFCASFRQQLAPLPAGLRPNTFVNRADFCHA